MDDKEYISPICSDNLLYALKKPTDNYLNEQGSSQIDCILSTHEDVILEYVIPEKHATNLSSHNIVTAVLDIRITSNLKQNHQPTAFWKYQWDKTDLLAFRDTLRLELWNCSVVIDKICIIKSWKTLPRNNSIGSLGGKISSVVKTSCLKIDNTEVNDPDKQRGCFMKYFEDLAIPKDKGYDEKYFELCTIRHKLIFELSSNSKDTFEPFTENEIQNGINHLHTGKAKDNIDNMKVFDVVSHIIVLDKLYETGVHPKIWTLIKDLYNGMTSTVRWTGGISDDFEILQGYENEKIHHLAACTDTVNDIKIVEQNNHEENTKSDILTESQSTILIETQSSILTESESSILTESESSILAESQSSILIETQSSILTESESSIHRITIIHTHRITIIHTHRIHSSIHTESQSSILTESQSSIHTESQSSNHPYSQNHNHPYLQNHNHPYTQNHNHPYTQNHNHPYLQNHNHPMGTESQSSKTKESQSSIMPESQIIHTQESQSSIFFFRIIQSSIQQKNHNHLFSFNHNHPYTQNHNHPYTQNHNHP
ncbi:unnamed protein product [Mytilus coruscus]|uniref:Endonuclease/exonuclease/phosphatase domain-containing protein n=1 Tax=Mytilus coruscus TaxID=42192 RepID=A0A6J8D245_MYTCO|nr:unnamed protein product [Mytilus coruscus]